MSSLQASAIKNNTNRTISNKYRCAAFKWSFMSVKLIRSLTVPSLVLERISFLSNVLQPFRTWQTVHHVLIQEKKGDVFCSRQSKLQYEKVTIREEKRWGLHVCLQDCSLFSVFIQFSWEFLWQCYYKLYLSKEAKWFTVCIELRS